MSVIQPKIFKRTNIVKRYLLSLSLSSIHHEKNDLNRLKNMTTRRSFLYKTAVAGSGLILSPQIAFSKHSKGDLLKVGLIGVGLRGTNHLSNLLLREDVSIQAICDIDQARIDLNLELIQKAGKKKPKG
jgi:hypothetical protein